MVSVPFLPSAHSMYTSGCRWSSRGHDEWGLQVLTSQPSEMHGNAWQQAKLVLNKDSVPYKGMRETGRSLVKVVFPSQGGLKSVGNFSTAY